MSAAGSSAFACERIVPGHHPALEQVANAPRYPHRLVEELRLEGEHTLRCHTPVPTLRSGRWGQ